jgi:endonuclease-3
MIKKNIDTFFTTLGELFPENRTDLIWETPRQLLVCVVMSAQTTDVQVNKVTAKFFDSIKTPYDTINLTEQQRDIHIR